MKKVKAVVKQVCQAVDQKKGDQITVLDVSEICGFTNFLIICQGYNQKQNQTICDEIREILKKEARLSPHHLEGYQSAEWILMDYWDFVIHIFSPQSREFYRLEKLWSDGVKINPGTLTF